MDEIVQAKRSRWRTWVAQEIGGDDPTIDAATDAILAALMQGADVQKAIAAGRQVASSGASPSDESSEHPVSDPDHLRGSVAGFRQRNELIGSAYGTVWDFRVDHWDADGVAQEPVAVEMRGMKFVGSVANGDWVEVEGPWKPGEIRFTTSLTNLSQNARVTAIGADRPRAATSIVKRVLRAILILFVIAFFLFVVFQLVTGFSHWR